jgi:hypothetical protein
MPASNPPLKKRVPSIAVADGTRFRFFSRRPPIAGIFLAHPMILFVTPGHFAH